MDFSVIRPKPPTKRPEPAAPKPPAEAELPPPPPPPTHEKSPPPQAPPAMSHVGHPYMEEFDRISRIQRLRTIEYTHARTWRMNFGQHPNDYYDNSYNNYGYHQNHHQGHMYDAAGRPPLPDQYYYSLTGPSPPDHNHGPLRGPAPCYNLLPPSDHNYGPLRGPPPYHNLLPPPDHNYGPLRGRAPVPYYGGGYFSDENPNGCMIM